MVLQLPPHLATVAEQELGETPAVREAALQQLRSKIEGQVDGHKPTRTDDAYLVMFLRHAKFDVDRAHGRVLAMSAFLHEHADLLKDLRAAEFREFYGCGLLSVLRGRAHSGARMTALVPASLEKFPGDGMWVKVVRFNVWSFSQLIADPYMQVHGMVILEDFAGLTLRTAMRLGSRQAKKSRQTAMRFLQECAPFRLQGIHVANEPVFFDLVFALVKPFMKPKLRERVRLLGSQQGAFLDVAPPEELPTRFGGTCAEPADAWLEALVAAEAAGQQGVTGLRS